MEQTMKQPQIKCPKCGSTQLYVGKKGFSGKKAVAGALLTGGIGVLAGTIGSNKIKLTCLACGSVFAPGENKQVVNQTPKVASNGQIMAAKVLAYIVAGVCWFLSLMGIMITLFAGSNTDMRNSGIALFLISFAIGFLFFSIGKRSKKFQFRKNFISRGDGSCIPVENYIKANLNDPLNYEHQRTSVTSLPNGNFNVITVFREKNEAGATLLNNAIAEVTPDGQIANFNIV